MPLGTKTNSFVIKNCLIDVFKACLFSPRVNVPSDLQSEQMNIWTLPFLFWRAESELSEHWILDISWNVHMNLYIINFNFPNKSYWLNFYQCVGVAWKISLWLTASSIVCIWEDSPLGLDCNSHCVYGEALRTFCELVFSAYWKPLLGKRIPRPDDCLKSGLSVTGVFGASQICFLLPLLCIPSLVWENSCAGIHLWTGLCTCLLYLEWYYLEYLHWVGRSYHSWWWGTCLILNRWLTCETHQNVYIGLASWCYYQLMATISVLWASGVHTVLIIYCISKKSAHALI